MRTKFLIILIILILVTVVYAADRKWSVFAVNTTVDDADELLIIDIGTGNSERMTVLDFFDTIDTSAELIAILTDETGTGAAVFAISPTLVTPVLGVIASGVGTTLTALNGENIQDDTIDNDSIDWGDMTDLTTDGALDADVVDEAHIADNGIDSEHYNDGSIDLVHIAAAAYAVDLVTTAPVTGAIDNVMVGADADVTIALDFTAAWNFGGAAGSEWVNDGNPTTDAAGELALDTTIVDHQPLWQYYDGGENMTIIAIDTAQLPALDNEIIKYDAGTDKFVLEADAGGGGGNDVYVEEGDAARVDSSGADLYIDFDDTDFGVGVVGNEGNITITDDGHAHTGASVTGIGDAQVDNNITIDLATLATTVTVTDDEATADNQEIVFTTDNTNLESDGDFYYNPNTGTVTATQFVGGGLGGLTAWDDITDPDNSGLITITFDNAEATLFTGDNDAAVSFMTIQNSDADHTGGNMYLLDLDYSADDGDVDADFIKFQDSGSVVMTIQQNGDITTDGGLVAGGAITEGGNAVPNATDNLGFFGGTSSAELYGELSDETGSAAGTPLAVFNTAPVFVTSIQLTGADANPAAAAGTIVYDSTIAGMSGGGLRWYDNDSVRVIVDLETDPSNDDYVVAYDSTADGFYMKVDDDTGGSTKWNAIGDADGVGLIDFVTYTQTIDIGVTDAGGGGSGLILDVTGLGAGTDDVIALEITTTADDDSDYIPFAIYDDSGNNNDLLFQIDSIGRIEYQYGATVYQFTDNYISFADNADLFRMYFDGTDMGMEWSDGTLNLFNSEDGVDAIVNIQGKDNGEKGILRVLSDGDDKYIEFYHDDTDAHIISSSGDIHIEAVGGNINFADDNTITSGSTTTATLILTGADADPAAAGNIKYDNTITGIMSGGGLRWYDNDSVRLLVDLETDPSNDDYVVAYDSTADGFYMKVDADTGGATAYDDIGDPDASGSISFDAAEGATYTSSDDQWVGVTISNTAADNAGDTELLTLAFTDDGDTNSHYLIMSDAAGTQQLEFIQNGADIQVTVTGDLKFIATGGDFDFADDTLTTTGTMEATTFSGALSGNSTTTTTASAGDAAVDFFGAGVDAVTDATTCTDIEGTGLSIGGTTLNWAAASTDLTDTAALLYETELDDFSELQTQIADKTLVNTADGATWSGTHDFGGADLEIPQAIPAVPGVDGGVELDFTDGKLVIQHGSAHTELGASTDVVMGSLIQSWSGTIFEPDGINDVMTVKAINSIEFPHGVVITAIYLGVSENSNYTLTVQNFDDFDTINGAQPTIDAVVYTADASGEIIDTSPTYDTIAAGQLIMISIPSTDVDWIHFEIYYYEPAA